MENDVPEMCRRVSSVEYQLLRRVQIFIDPFAPCLQGPPISLYYIQFWIEDVTLFKVVFPTSREVHIGNERKEKPTMEDTVDPIIRSIMQHEFIDYLVEQTTKKLIEV